MNTTAPRYIPLNTPRYIPLKGHGSRSLTVYRKSHKILQKIGFILPFIKKISIIIHKLLLQLNQCQ